MKRFWPIGIIIAIWMVFSYPYWGKGQIPFPSTYLVTFFAPWSTFFGMPVKNNAMPDVITQIYPWKRLTIETWKMGELPLWNPYSFSGTSHVGNYQSAIFSPLNLLFMVLPEIHAWSIMILLQPMLAGVFMFLFLRSLGVSREGSIVGSVSFMFCGFITVWMAYGTLGYAVLFLPFILYGLHAFVVKGQRWAGPLAALAVGVSFLSGHFQMSLYVLLYACMFLVFLLFRESKKQRVGFALLYIVAGMLFAAPQILPAFDSYTNAVRSSIFGKGEVIPWRYIVTLFSPDFFGNPVTRNDWFGHYAEWAGFIGVVPLLLAVFAVSTKWKDRVIRYFLGMAALSLLLAFQTPLLDLLYALKIPVLSTSSASRIIILTSFSLAVLSGFGMDSLIVRWTKRDWKQVGLWCLGTLTLIIAIWALLILIRPLPPEKLMIAVRNTILPSIFAVVLLGVAMVGCLLPKRFLVLLPFILIGTVGFDMYRFTSKWMPFDPAGFVYPQFPVLNELQLRTRDNHARIFGNIGNEAGSPFGLALLEGYDAVYQQRYGKFISSASDGSIGVAERSVVRLNKGGEHSEEVLQFLGVRFYAHKKSDGRLPWAYPFWEYPQYNRVWEDEQYEILENDSSLPRAFLASSYEVVVGEQEILNALYSPNIDKRETLILERKPVFDPAPGEGAISISSYRPNSIQFEVSSTSPKLLFLSDTYDAGWKASVDNTETDVYRADYDFRAVAVPAGVHTVRMWYAPQSVYVGFAMSGFATLSMVAFFFLRKKI